MTPRARGRRSAATAAPDDAASPSAVTTARRNTAAPLDGDWSNLIVFCAATSWDGNRFPDQHMAERLTAYAPVLYVDPPISPLTARHSPELIPSLRHPGLRLVAPRLARITPVVLPFHSRGVMRDVTDAIRRRLMARAARRLGGDVHAVVAASFADVFGVCGERRRILYGTDDFTAGADLMNLDAGRLSGEEARQLDAADTVVVVSPWLQDKWRAAGREPVLVPNGCDASLFARTDAFAVPADVRLEPPIAGFMGHLSHRIDLAILEAIAERGISLLLVGPRQATLPFERIERILIRPNVQWTGARPFASLPGYLKAMDVGVVPYADSEFNRASFPLKTLEYLAGGRPAVATDLPSVRWLDTDLVTIADRDGFVAALEAELTRPRDEELAARRRTFAEAHSWDRRAADFARALGLAVPAA